MIAKQCGLTLVMLIQSKNLNFKTIKVLFLALFKGPYQKLCYLKSNQKCQKKVGKLKSIIKILPGLRILSVL